MTMITPSYLGETIEYSSLHACRSTLEDPTRLDCYFCPVAHSMSVMGIMREPRDFSTTPNGRQHPVHRIVT